MKDSDRLVLGRPLEVKLHGNSRRNQVLWIRGRTKASGWLVWREMTGVKVVQGWRWVAHWRTELTAEWQKGERTFQTLTFYRWLAGDGLWLDEKREWAGEAERGGTLHVACGGLPDSWHLGFMWLRPLLCDGWKWILWWKHLTSDGSDADAKLV